MNHTMTGTDGVCVDFAAIARENDLSRIIMQGYMRGNRGANYWALWGDDEAEERLP